MTENLGAGIRPLKAPDLERVVEIDTQIVGRPRRRFFEKRLEAALADADGFITAAITGPDDIVAGYAIARIQNGEFGGDHRIAVIDVIGIDPDARHTGNGGLILDWIAEKANEANVTELRTQIDWQSRDLIHFFSGAGFEIADRYILECQSSDMRQARAAEEFDPFVGDDMNAGISQTQTDAGMADFSDPGGDDFEALARDKIPVRSMREDDLDTVIRIDSKFTGRDRRDYYQAKFREVLSETGIRISLLAEVDNLPVGYIMARVDYGEYGRTEPVAVIDTLGVHPGFGHHGVGSALMTQLLVNLAALHVDAVRTNVTWNNFPLLDFLGRSGFKPAQRLSLARSSAGSLAG